ncbi:hypothetical protein CROQUDRAFT_110611 [Cronartium quercuum f. sp. fusiforme G11]|uniref:Uncharacterized protein n=1 Tax=Cronartium quercuum f. sp. fusiforme G11 TaxID=708437 RepID=A0A9P6NBI1_9BASI|nr:hypothetical protein CROQUDRAFT_110611 [Cronartium quercuum f. sp. fusiforme G11]
MAPFADADEIVKALSDQDPALLGSGLAQLRHACTARPAPKAIFDFLRQDPTASAVSGALSVAREVNSIHLLSNCLYTLAHLISLPTSNHLGSQHVYDAARIIHDIMRHHSKSLHRCFAPGRTEATLACLSLLYACVSWNDGACAHVVITDLRWDQKTISRLLDTRQTVTLKSTAKVKRGPKQATSKTSKLKGRLHEVDVRTLVLKLVMKIMTIAELRPALKLEFWRTKGLSTGLFKGLRSDGYRCIAFVLSNLWDGVVRKDGWTNDQHKSSDASGFDKAYDSRWDILDQTATTTLIELLDDEGTDSASDRSNQVASPSESIAELVERFLTHLTDYISDFTPSNVFQSHVNSRLPQYRILLNLIKSLSPTQSIRHQRLTLHILRRSPSLCSTLWRHAAPAAESSCTVNWISSVGFASKIASIPVTVPTSTKHRALLTTDNRNTITNICSNLLAQCFPTPLGKTWFTKNLHQSNSLIVYCCLSMLVIGMKKAASIANQIQKAIQQYEESSCEPILSAPSASSGPWSNLLTTFTEMLQSILPDLQILIALLQKAPKPVSEPQTAASKEVQPDFKVATSTSISNEVKVEEFSSDLISVHVLAFLQLCHDLIPNSIYNIRFDYRKLIPVYLKVDSSDSPDKSPMATTSILDPLIYLCQSRILHLVGYSASMNHMMPSSTLLTCLLSLSSSTRKSTSPSYQSGYVPASVRYAARQTLKAVLECNVPHLRDVHETQEIRIWIDLLTELRLHEECALLISFLDDCIRACLRSPLKYVESAQELAPENTKKAAFTSSLSILYAALVTKTKTVINAFTPGEHRNSKIELISQLIKFHNLHIFATLSSSHKFRPMATIENTCEILRKLFATLPSSHEGPLSGCEYLGPMVNSILRGLYQPNDLDRRLQNHKLEWPVYVTVGMFSRQLVTLNFLHRKFLWPKIEKELGKCKKKGVLMVEFGLESFHLDPTHSEMWSQQFKEQNLCFMIRVLECEHQRSYTHGVEEDSEVTLDFDKLKSMMELIADYVDDDSEQVKSFLKDVHVSYVLKRAIKAADSTSLFSDVLCRLLPKLDTLDPTHCELAQSYADLMVQYISTAGSVTIHVSRTSASVACILFPFLDLPSQIHLLDIVLKSTKLKPAALAEEPDLFSLHKMTKIAGECLKQSSSSINLSLASITTLINLACSEAGESASQLLSILVRQIPLFNPTRSLELDQNANSRLAAEQHDKLLQVWHKLVSKTLGSKAGGSRISAERLQLIGDLSRRDPQTYASSVKWMATTTTEQFVGSLEGVYNLLLACVEIFATENVEQTWPKPYAVRINSEQIAPWVSSITSVLFNDKITLDSSNLSQQRAQRIAGCKVLEAICQSSLEVKLDDFFATFATASDLLPAYAETLDTLRNTRSIHTEAYVGRCLRWLVRRFAEDEILSKETSELSESLNTYLRSSDLSLPVHLVNPVLSAAIDRWLASDFVIRLVDTLVQHTTFSETDTLKHARTVVENRQFKGLMIFNEGETEGVEQASTVMSFITTMVLSFPKVAVKINLSASLIGYYGGTISAKDRSILRVFRIEDMFTQDSQFDQLLLNWKLPGQTVTSKLVFMELINHLDSQKMYSTCLQCLKADVLTAFKESESYYDPDFVLPYFHYIMHQSAISMSCWNSIARANILGLAMCALSSSSRNWRLLGDRCLTKAYSLLKVITHTDAAELLLPLERFRCLHFPKDSSEKSCAVPRLTTLFLVQCLHIFSARPESSIYPRLSRFLMQRPVIDVTDVPMLYTMLYSDGDCPAEDQRWLLELLRDGLNTTRDWKIMDRRQTFEILTTVVLSMGARHSDPNLKILLLELFERATAHNQPCTKLVTQSGLMSVLKHLGHTSTVELQQLIKILQNVTSRLGLLHENVAIECVDRILELIRDLCQSRFFEGQ